MRSGPDGPPGDKGDTGIKGYSGVDGQEGRQGPDGPPGDQGVPVSKENITHFTSAIIKHVCKISRFMLILQR